MTDIPTTPDPLYALTLAEADQLPLLALADIAGRSNFFSCVNKEQAAMKLLLGQELGFTPCASLTGIHIVEGRPMVGANMYAAAIKRHPHYDYEARIAADDCAVTFYWMADKANPKSVRRELGTLSVSMAEAIERGWTVSRKGSPKTNWVRHPDAMLFARAISQGVRYHAPDVFNGLAVYVDGELEPEHVEPEVAEPVIAEVLPEVNDTEWPVRAGL